MNNGFTKDMLARVTIITSHYDGNNAWVQNQYAEKTGIFKNLAPGAEGTLLVSEVNMALKGAAENCVVEGVYLIENRNNSDMTEINKIKRTLELRLESKGYKIVNHAPQAVKFDEQAINDWIESHNLYDIKAHQIKEVERIKNELEKQRDELEKEVASLVRQKEAFANLSNDFSELNEDYQKKYQEVSSKYSRLKEEKENEYSDLEKRNKKLIDEVHANEERNKRLAEQHKCLQSLIESSGLFNVDIDDIAEKAQLFDKICKEDGLDKERIKKMKEFISHYERFKEENNDYWVCKGNSDMLKAFESDYGIKRGIAEAREIFDMLLKYFKVSSIDEVKERINL